ncbi:MAG: SPOR domain-containing protein [Burkholderiales bacterium]|nr:SPOR domain-containing protein [Burkholderiales bacterium]
MLKFFFFTLLATNAALFAWHRGYLNDIIPSDREPARLQNQLNPGKIKLMSASAAQTVLAAAAQENGERLPPESSASTPSANGTPAATPAPTPEKKAEAIACTEIGNFLPNDAKRFENLLSALALGERQSRINVQEVASHMVYIPSQGSKEGADKKAAELRSLGITNFYVLQDNSALRWGISLGIFKTEEAAQRHLATLNSQGVRTAKVGARNSTTNKVAFQLRNIDLDARGKLEKIKAGFPNQEMKACSK